MPNISLTLPETEQSVTRPIVINLVKQLQEITKVNKDAKIFYQGDSQKMHTPGSTINDKDNEARFETGDYLFIEVDEDFDKEAILTTPVANGYIQSIYLDDSINAYIKPVYAPTTISINFKYRCTSKSEAKRWRDDIRMKLSQNTDLNIHTLTYQYILPAEILAVLMTIHHKREEVLPYNQTFQQYIVSHFTDRLSIVSDLVNNDYRLTIAETQTRIIGLYDFSDLPEKPEKGDNGTWTVQMNYKITYDKPIACNMRYPVIVHNQLLPPLYVDFVNNDFNYDDKELYAPGDIASMHSFQIDTLNRLRRNNDYKITIPEFDDYILPTIPTGTGTVFTALCEVDTDNKTLLNLLELGDYEIDNDILEFIIQSERPYIVQMYKSILNLDIYRNNQLSDRRNLELDINLNLKSKNELNLRHEHRVRFSITVDLTLLDIDAIRRLRKYPKAFVKIIAAMNELLRHNPDFNNLGNEKYISEYHFNAIYRLLTGFSYNNGTGIGNHYYGSGRNINNWPNRGEVHRFLDGIDPRLVENYRRNKVGMNTVMVTGIIGLSNKEL